MQLANSRESISKVHFQTLVRPRQWCRYIMTVILIVSQAHSMVLYLPTNYLPCDLWLFPILNTVTIETRIVYVKSKSHLIVKLNIHNRKMCSPLFFVYLDFCAQKFSLNLLFPFCTSSFTSIECIVLSIVQCSFFWQMSMTAVLSASVPFRAVSVSYRSDYWNLVRCSTLMLNFELFFGFLIE